MHLYQLSDSYRNLLSQIESEDCTDETLKAELTNITTQLSDKAESIGKLVLDLEAESIAMQNEIARLSQRKRITENKIEWLKDYVKQEMLNSGMDKLTGSVLTLSLRKSPPSVTILNKDDIEPEFRRVIPETWEVNKVAILTRFKDTGEIPKGCEIVTDKKTLLIK